MLWDPAAHEPLVENGWDEDRARAAIRAIVADAEAAFADGWPAHPDDVDSTDRGPWHGLSWEAPESSTRCGGSPNVGTSKSCATTSHTSSGSSPMYQARA
jgi:hypothetical protein